MDLKLQREPAETGPQTAESEDEAKRSRKLPESVSGKGDTPLGSSDQHSDAPGPFGTG